MPHNDLEAVTSAGGASSIAQADKDRDLVFDPQSKSLEIEKSKAEKRFLRKLDMILLTYGCISQVIKYLDQTNINNAYVSGMSDDLNFTGNELNYFTTYFNVGYCIFLIPSQIMITWFRPSLWLPGLEFVWGIFTGCIAACTTSSSIYGLRALIGMAESSCYPGTVTLLMAWYTPLEMAKRIGFYHSCQAVGSMLAGALQTAIHESLEGKHGLRGWQWTFVINCIMTCCLALLGPLMIPDFPDKPNPLAFWITPVDREIAMARLERFKRVDVNPINLKTFKRTLSNPFLYMAIYIYVGMLIAVSGINYFQLWLKSLTNPDGSKVWGISQLNAIPMGGYAMQMVGIWCFAYASDFFRTRWLIILIICLIGIPSTVIMTVWNVPNSAKYYAYFILFPLQSHAPPLWSWMSDMLPTDAEQRALIMGISITMYYAINAWSNVLIFPAVQAPHYKYGWPVCLALWVTSGLVVCGMRVYDVKVIRPRNYRKAQEALEEQQVATAQYVSAGDAKDNNVMVRTNSVN